MKQSLKQFPLIEQLLIQVCLTDYPDMICNNKNKNYHVLMPILFKKKNLQNIFLSVSGDQ